MKYPHHFRGLCLGLAVGGGADNQVGIGNTWLGYLQVGGTLSVCLPFQRGCQ